MRVGHAAETDWRKPSGFATAPKTLSARRTLGGGGGGSTCECEKARLMMPKAALALEEARLLELPSAEDTLLRLPMSLLALLGLPLPLAMRLKMPRRADTAAPTLFWMLLQAYLSRMKSSMQSSMESIRSRHTLTASAMMVVPVIQRWRWRLGSAAAGLRSG